MHNMPPSADKCVLMLGQQASCCIAAVAPYNNYVARVAPHGIGAELENGCCTGFLLEHWFSGSYLGLTVVGGLFSYT